MRVHKLIGRTTSRCFPLVDHDALRLCCACSTHIHVYMHTLHILSCKDVVMHTHMHVHALHVAVGTHAH